MSYRRLLRWAALPVTDRRWAAPLSAVALGFGLFVGVAIGPGTAGTFAGGVPQIIEIPGFGESGDASKDVEIGGEGGETTSSGALSMAGEGEGEEAFAPLLGGEESALVPVAEEPSPVAEPTTEEDEKKEPQSKEEELTGAVVHVNPAAGSYTVAESGGVMSAVHAGKLPQVGAVVTVPIRSLANGTLAEAGKRVADGETAGATLAGIVTSVDADPSAPAYTVSNRGASVLVHVRPDPSGVVPALPVLGAYVTATVDLEAAQPVAAESAPIEPAPAPEPVCALDPASPPPSAEPSVVLWQREVSGGGAPFTHSDFAGIITVICPDTAQLLISADDVREGESDLLFAVPPEIDLSGVEPGQSVLAAADIAADGALSLTGLASDERLKGADDAKAIQGDLVPEKPKGQG